MWSKIISRTQLRYFKIVKSNQIFTEKIKMNNSTSNAAGTSAGANEYEEQIMVLQLNGVLDFEAVKKAAQIGAIRVRNASTNAPLVQVGSSLYSAEWMQTIGTDLIFCVSENTGGDAHPNISSKKINPLEKLQQLDLIAASDTRLDGKKVLLATDNGYTQNNQCQYSKDGNNVNGGDMAA